MLIDNLASDDLRFGDEHDVAKSFFHDIIQLLIASLTKHARINRKNVSLLFMKKRVAK